MLAVLFYRGRPVPCNYSRRSSVSQMGMDSVLGSSVSRTRHLYFACVALASTYFIGLAIGIDLALDGAALLGFVAAIHSLPIVQRREA